MAGRRAWQRFLRDPQAVLGLAGIGGIGLLAATAHLLYPDGPWKMVAAPMLPPLSPGFPLGTDILGRDVAAQVAYGAAVSLLVGIVSTMVTLLVGIALGAVAGYLGGHADDAIMRLTEFVQTIPSFVLAVVLVALFRPSVLMVIVAISVVSWPPVVRLVRGEFLSLRSREFVQAAIVIGQRRATIIFRQILPNALPPVIALATLMVASAVLLESALSFLGLGDPNVISWGYMISNGRTVMHDAWWVSIVPGILLFITVLAINLLGEALSAALDPRTQQRGPDMRTGSA
jgi:peptide/nickel transport system permease protein